MEAMRAMIVSAFCAASLLPLSAGIAQSRPMVYPAKGQSPEKQSQDEAQCYTWARQNSGVDPVASAPTTATGPQGERARGAMRGAVGGAAIGAIAGDTGKGAGVGAVAGTMAGGHRARKREAYASAEQQGQRHSMDSFQRAWAACMSGRGYTVS